MYGVKTLKNRRKLLQSLSNNYHYWIDASDTTSESNWVWLNGEPESSSELIWAIAQPEGGRRENCVAVVSQSGHFDINRTHDH